MTLPKTLHHTLTHLSRDRSPTRWTPATTNGAPHKPVLLLALATNVASGRITGPELPLEGPAMLGVAEDFYELLDPLLGDRRSSIHMPVWHLQSDKLWQLYDHYDKPATGGRPSGWGPLRAQVACARMQTDLYAAMQDDADNRALRELLLEHYFDPPTATLLRDRIEAMIAGHGFAQRILELGRQPRTRDAKRFYQATLTIPPPVRSAGFRHAVRAAYDHRCATCGVRIVLADGRSLMQAAHIHAWSDSHDDRVVNGLALCPTCHWAFDALVLRVQPQSRTIRFAAKGLPEHCVAGHLGTLDGRPLIAPADEVWQPDQLCLEWRWKQRA